MARWFGKAPRLVPRAGAVAAAPRPPAPSPEESQVAAVNALSDGAELKRLAGLSGLGSRATDTTKGGPAGVPGPAGAPGTPGAVERAAQARLAQLLEAGQVEFSVLFTTPAEVAHLVIAGQSSRLRQAAAGAVVDAGQLRALLKQARNKDKSVYKILKQKCDVLDAFERQATDRAQEIELQCLALERHARRSFDPAYVSALEWLERQWRALDPRPVEPLEQRATLAIDRSREVVAAHLRAVAAQAAQDVAREAAKEARRESLAAAAAAAAGRAATDAQAQADARAAHEAEQAALAEQRSAQEQVFRQIGGLIRQARAALGDGATQRAAGLRRALESRVAAAPGLPPYLARQLQTLDEELQRLKQWKDYAVAPKRLELIEAMQALIGSTEPPQVVADHIKTLQQEWRTTSKGIVGDAPDEWERFHQASQAAYQPCREYFAAQALLRRENLLGRRTVLERVTAVEAAQAEHWDWRLLTTVLREAPQEWRRHFPVEREANRPLQAAFEATLGRLQALLDGWWEGNAAEKKALVARARQLLALEDSREAIEGVKQLQLRWKEVGSAARDREQALWNEFREVCDAVYQRRQQAFVEYSAGLEANKQLAIALCDQAEALAAAPDAKISEGEIPCAEWSAAFEALGEMPRADARPLRARFDRALAACQTQRQQQQSRAADAALRNLFEAGRLLHAYQWSVSSAAAESEQAVLLQAVQSHIDGVPQWPRDGLAALRHVLAAAASPSAPDVVARETALRLLCVRAELLGGSSTPPEDESLRRDHQVQRLMQGMGQGRRAEESWEGLLLEWVRADAVAPARQALLEVRFSRAWPAGEAGGVEPR